MVCDCESEDKNTLIAELLTTDEGLLLWQNVVLCVCWEKVWLLPHIAAADYIHKEDGAYKLKYALPNVTKYQVYQFFMSTKNLHIKSFTLIPSRLYCYAKLKIYTSSLLHCYQLPISF